MGTNMVLYVKSILSKSFIRFWCWTASNETKKNTGQFQTSHQHQFSIRFILYAKFFNYFTLETLQPFSGKLLYILKTRVFHSNTDGSANILHKVTRIHNECNH